MALVAVGAVLGAVGEVLLSRAISQSLERIYRKGSGIYFRFYRFRYPLSRPIAISSPPIVV